jgi:hypothetical protein
MPGKKPAAILGGALLAGLLCALIFTVRDEGRRRELETVSEPRAVGDSQFFPESASLASGQTLARFEGRELVAAEGEPVEIRDSRMLKAGSDESGAFQVYRPLDKENNGFLFLKIGRDKYVKATVR